MNVPQEAARNDEQSDSHDSGYLVKTLSPGDEARWDKFVVNSTAGTFYHLSGWKSIIENALHHRTFYLQCEYDGRLRAILPLAQVKSLLFGNALISIPFLVYGGPIADSQLAEKIIVREAIELANNLQVDYLELRNLVPLNIDEHDDDWHRNDSYVTFRKRLLPDPEKNLAAIPRKQRAMIRKGIKAGLKAESDTDIGRLYTALLECKRNLGTPFFGRRYLRSIYETFPNHAEILTVTHKGKTVSSVMSFRFRNEILPYYGGGGEMARYLKGNDFLYWSLMERACQSGIDVFDYGRSMVGSGAYRFKKHWGFDETPLAYYHHLVASKSVPQLNPSNPKYRFLINRWKQLPLPLARILGPPIARRLG